MINKFKQYFSKIKIVFKTSAIVLLMGLFFSINKTVKAEELEYELSFYIDEFNSYSLFYSQGELLEEIPTLESYYIFVGWYDNELFNGDNYYGKPVDELMPSNLYALFYYKDPVIDDLEVVPYLDGYEITLYTGLGSYLNIPSYYYEETEIADLYEVKDILSINKSVFVSNNNFTYITIPKTVINIDSETFSYLDNLTGVYVNQENLYYSNDAYGVLLNKEQTEIIHFPNKLNYDVYEVPESVEIIKSNTFLNTTNIKKVIIGSNVTKIETEAFKNNKDLEFVLIDDGLLDRIEAEAFLNNNNLIKVMIPLTVTYVGSDAFKGSNTMLNIYYQDKVSNIPISWDDFWNVSGYNIVEEYDLLTYTVTYLNDDDSIIDTEVVSFNNDAVKEVIGVKESDAQYIYTFNRFEGVSLTNIVSDITVKALYYKELKYYTVTFHDALGDVYGTMSFPYGENPNNNYWFTDVKKDADLEYKYYFESWDKDLTFIDSDLFVYPVFRSELIYYTVIFYFDDFDNQFEYYSLPYNTYLEAPIETPTKQSTEVYNYVFDGWYLDFEKTIPFTNRFIEGELHIYPKFVEVLRTYRVEFYNNNVLYDIQNITYGNFAVTPTDPTRASTDKYHYEFTGWSVDFSNITSYLRVDALYIEILRSYSVKFYSDENLISEQIVYYEMPAVSPNEPVKESDAQYTYVFAGWDKDFNNIRSNLNVYATYTKIPNVYTVSYNTDGGSLIETHNQTYNTFITRPTNPIKVGYSFSGWYKDSSFLDEWSFNTLMPASDLTLYAKWSINSYTISFISNGGSSVDSLTKEYNTLIFSPDEPTRSGYTFVGWYTEIELINEYVFDYMPASNITLYAGWTVNTYTVIFNSLGGSDILPLDVLYNSLITLPDVPTKVGYTFVGWYSDIDLVNEWNFNYNYMPASDITLYAKWVINSYKVTFYQTEESITPRVVFSVFYVEHGSDVDLENLSGLPVKASTAIYVYEFNGWSGDLLNVTENREIYALYTESLREYDVNFYSDGILVSRQKVYYGESAFAPMEPVKEKNEQYSYLFIGWDKDFKNITSNLNVYALFEQTLNEYTVRFYDEDNSLIKETLISYGASASPPRNPVKESTTKYDYTFIGWDKDFSYIVSDLDVYAIYEQTIRSYIVRFYNENILLTTLSVEYGQAAVEPEDPEKESTPEYNYTFIGWDKDFSNIISDLDVYAVFEESFNSYYIYFEVNGGSVIEPKSYKYNDIINEPPQPEKAGYTFVGWYVDSSLLSKYVFDYMPANDLTLYAKWEIIFYQINYLNTYGLNNLNPSSYNITSESIVLTDLTSRDSHFFVGFYTDLEGGILVKEIEKGTTGNITLYARWEIKRYTVSFYNYDNSLIETSTVMYGSSAIEPIEPTRSGYTFVGWDKDFSNITSDLSVIALYEINTYEVIFNSFGSINVNYNSLITKPENPNKVGYSFLGWYTSEDIVWDFNNDLMPAYDLTLYAKWSINSYTISFISNGGSDVLPLTRNYNEEILAPIAPVRIGYTFIGWYTEIELINEYVFEYMPASNITLYAGWLINTYTVKFYNDDNSFLNEVVVAHGSNASYVTPTKESTTKYHYEFSGWSLSVDNVISDLTVYATYNELLRSYRISFYSKESSFIGNNPVLQTNILPYGSLIVPPSDPTKESTVEYSYTFIGWDKEFSTVNGDLSLYPVFIETLREYTVKFYNDDYETILKEEKVLFGSSANPPEEPTKASTARYDFHFAGWDKDFSNITGNLNVYATYDGVIRTYKVNFYNGPALIETVIVEYGSSVITSIEPTKPSTKEFTYQFIGWSEDLLFISEDIDVYAVFEEKVRQYTVYFYDDDRGYYIGSVEVNYGEEAIFDIIPEKAATEQYNYEFTGWSEDLTYVTESMQVYALYEAHIREYTVIFLVYDSSLGDVILKEEVVSYGNSATPPIVPEKESTEKYEYIFDRWSLDYTFVDGNIRVYALFVEVLREYKVSFYSENELYDYVMTPYGNNVVLPTIPTKEPTVDLEFSFVGWYLDEQFVNIFDPLTEIKTNINLYAKYEESVRSYTVKFYNENRLFEEQVILYGSLANIPQIPTKASTTYYNYEFIGWYVLGEEFNFEQEIVENLEIHATYKETNREYTVYFYDGQILLNEVKVVAGEAAVVLDPIKESTDKFHYEFNRWDKPFNNVLSNLTVYAIFDEILREYTVYFYNDLNEVIKEEKVFYGSSATAPEAPIKEPTEKYNYLFVGWSRGFINIYNDLHVYPVYNEVVKTFTVNFYNGDVLLKSSTVEYGNSTAAPPNPEKESTEMYDYIFTGWSLEYSYVVDNLDVYAVYEEVIKTFIVSFYNHDGLIKFSEVEVTYGEDATPPTNTERDKTEQYEYIFTGWDKDFSNVRENLNVYATYEQKLRTFTVNFYNEDVLVDSLTVNYGTKAISEIIPTKEGTTKYNYIFSSWSSNLDYIISDLDVYAVYEEVIKTFTVTFYNDNAVLKRQTVTYFSSATPPNNPSKEATEMYEYIFAGWSVDFTYVVSDLNVYAVFNKTLREYTVKFYSDDNSILKEEVVLYGNSATPPENPEKTKTAQYSYIFTHWDKDFSNIISDLNVYAVYDVEINSYEVTYFDYLNNVYKKEVLTYGSIITPPEGPIKESDKYNNYKFKNWVGYIPGMIASENISFTPAYEEEEILYTIILFINYNEHKFHLPYLSLFPDLDGYMIDNNKYTYLATGAKTATGEQLDSIPEYVEDNITLTIVYTPYIKESYLTEYLNNTSFNSPRGYRSLVDAYLMLEEVLEVSEELLILFKEKETEYNEFVEKMFVDLIVVNEYENKIFGSYFEITVSLQLLSYALYSNKRRWFYA